MTATPNIMCRVRANPKALCTTFIFECKQHPKFVYWQILPWDFLDSDPDPSQIVARIESAAKTFLDRYIRTAGA